MQLKSIKLLFVFTLLICSSIGFSQDIFTAIMQGNLDKTKELIEGDASLVSNKNARGFAPIHFAANFKQLEIAKLLINNGADPFILGAFNRQPVHWAAAGGSYEVLTWLHSIGADLNVKDETGKTPIYLAATRGHKKNVDYLLSQNAEIQTSGDGTFELFYFSITQNHEGIITKLLDSDFDLKEVSDDGTTLIHAAALVGNIDLLATLVDRGININHLNDFGECALHISIINQHFEAMKKVLELGADINLQNFVGQNALSLAVKQDSSLFTDFLKTKGAANSSNFTLNNKYPGFEQPGLTPKLLAPGLISTSDRNERDIMFSPEMDEFYFSRHWAAIRMPMTIQKMSKLNGIWAEPTTASFSGKFSDGECFITTDNKNLYLISQRPHDGSDKPSNWEIWVADRNQGDWNNFRLFDTVNLKGCFYPSITKEGELLYTSADNNLFLSKINNGKVEDIKKLGSEINTEGGEYNAMISPNGDYIIFTSHGFEDHYGGGDLYISFRNDDGDWTQSLNMGPEINTTATEYCPNVSPDEKFFFFTSNKKGTEDIYWVDAAIIEPLRVKAFRK